MTCISRGQILGWVTTAREASRPHRQGWLFVCREHTHLARGTWRVSRCRGVALGHAHLAHRLSVHKGLATGP